MLGNLATTGCSTRNNLSELKDCVLLMFGLLLVFRIGSFIPIPGVNTAVLANLFEQQKGTILEMFNMFSGGALKRASIFSLGIMPYISASIMVQLLTVAYPIFAELKKEGEAGRRTLSQYTRYGTFALAVFNAIGITIGLPNMISGLVIHPGFSFYFISTVSLVTGSLLLMWLGEQITERGAGNGISLIIFTGIVANLPAAIGQTIEQARQGELHPILLFLIIAVIFAVTYCVVFFEQGQRHISVNYPQRQQGRRQAIIQSSRLSLKVNMAGVIPAIFASSIILFPTTLAKWFGKGIRLNWLSNITFMLQPGQPLYILLYGVSIIFFSFFYTALIFNPREMAEEVKRSGGIIAGIRPGEQTAKYIDKVVTRLTLAGALYIVTMCLVPEFLIITWRVPFYFGGTSLLIVVVVIMELRAQLNTRFISYQYQENRTLKR